MNKKQRPSRKGKRRAAMGLAVCFITAVGLTGIYTWSNYKDRAEKELALAEEEQNASGLQADASEETNSTAQKAETESGEEEYTQGLQEGDTVQEMTPSAGSEENTGTDGSSAAETSGAASQVSFTEDSQLLWPVDGQVLMSYSMDKTVYFSTLDQYRYNPAMIISGAVNDNVIAAAPGTVKSIDESAQTGTTVTVDMGNGYECLYGQLTGVTVYAGDYVEAGTVLGYLAEPTKYYSLEGCNLYFEMRKDGQPVNPADYLPAE